MIKRRKIQMSSTQIILLSFLIVILVGSILLSLPISAKNGKISYIDALFTATTATCVTGLVTVSTASSWSVFGQVIILILIQIGGLGVITILTAFMLMINKKIGISDRLLIQDAFNLNTLSGLVVFVKRVLLGTLIIEFIGALFYMIVFIPEFGARGIWISIFNSISAFCNAGMDIIGETSLYNYATNPIINITTSILIILGGLGYIVWWDIIRVIKLKKNGKYKFFKHLTLHSKIALCSTMILIVFGAITTLVFEYSNDLTIHNMSFFDKIQVSFFQSITTRTAGFATIPQENLTNATAISSMILMFIGGSPVGTAGGVKTVTIAVLLYTSFSMIKGKNEATIFNRTISKQSIVKAIAVVITFFSVVLTSMILLSAVTKAPGIDIMFETISAAATVGLSRNLTTSLNVFGKIIIIITMYFGRVGPISCAIAFGSKRSKQNAVNDPYEEISIG